MKSPKVKTSAKNTAGPRGVRFKEDNGSGLDGSYPITQGPENPPAPASYSSEDDEASTSGIFIHSSTNPSASVSFGTNLFPLTSTFGQSPHPNFSPFVPSTSTHPAFTPEANSFAPFGKFNPCGLQAPAYINMADYQNVAPPAGGLHFQPPVPDTTYGPMQHVYVPRFDNGMAPGGLYHVGLPQTQVTRSHLPFLCRRPHQRLLSCLRSLIPCKLPCTPTREVHLWALQVYYESSDSRYLRDSHVLSHSTVTFSFFAKYSDESALT